MFEADVDAGEDSAMSKEEPDFRGRDFEKQYACRLVTHHNHGFENFNQYKCIVFPEVL